MSSGKPERSMLWIAGIIWLHIIVIYLIVSFSITPLLVFLREFVLGYDLTSILIGLFNLGIIIFSVKLGVKSVLAKGTINKEKILNISISTGLFFFLWTGSFFLVHIIDMGSFDAFNSWVTDPWVSTLLAGTIACTGATYFWFRKLVK